MLASPVPLALAALLFAAVDPAVVPQQEPVEKRPSLEGFQLQLSDDPLTPLQPLKPRTAVDQERVEAMAWFAAGQLLEAKSDFQGAYAAYKKAVAHDADSISLLHKLIPLAFSLNQTEEAFKYMLRAVELDPTDFRLLRKLGANLANNNNNVAGAIKLFEQAAQQPNLKKDTPLYVTLMRDLGVLYRATNRHKEAADCLAVVFDALQNHAKYNLDSRTRKELQADPNIDYEKLGQAFLEAERSDLALQAFEKAAQVRKGSPGNLSFNLAQVYVQTKQADKALAELQKYFDAQRQSKGRAAYQLLADALEQAGKSGELMARLEALAEKDARNSTLQFYLAEQYLKADRLDDAEALFKKTLAFDSEPVGFLGLASIYRRQNKPRELLETLVKGFTRGKGSLDGLKPELEAIQKDPKLVESLIEAGRKLAHEDPPQLDFAGSYVLGNLAAEAGQWEAAQEFYQIALASRKGKPAELYQELARHLFDAKRYGDAAKVYKTAVEDPALAERKVQFLYLLSRVLELNNETKEAIEAITAALKEIPDNEGLKFQEAWIYYHSQQFDEAIPRLEKLISSADDKEIQRQAQFSLSNVYVQQGNILKGEAILEAVLKEDPNDPSVNNDLGYLYADQGKNLEQAESMITKALTAEPENVAYLDSMGWVLFKRGKFAEALPHLEKACQKPAGVDATIWDHLADVYDRLEQPAKALQNWTKALEEAKQSPRPDTKLIGRIEEKIKNHKAGTGQLRPERPNSP